MTLVMSSPLVNELATVRAYVSIEKERFQDRLDMQYDIDESIELKVPMLIIQPLVENAIRHGIMIRNAGGFVRLTVRHEEDTVLIKVEDNGVGIEPQRLQKLLGQPGTRSGVGLMNIQRRLILHYGIGMHIWSQTGEGTAVTLQIPLNTGRKADDDQSYIAG